MVQASMPADRLGNMPPKGREVAAADCLPAAFAFGCVRLAGAAEVAERCGALAGDLPGELAFRLRGRCAGDSAGLGAADWAACGGANEESACRAIRSGTTR